MNPQDQLNELFTKRYDYLLECANNILKKIRRQDLKYELVNDCYIHINTKINENKENVLKPISEGKIEGVAVNWMKKQIIWEKTDFKKAWVYPDNKTQSLDRVIIHDNDTPSRSKTTYIDNISDTENEVTNEQYLEEEKDIQDKLAHIAISIAHQPLDIQLLFDDIFNKGINTSGKLAKHTGISRTASYYLIKDLKEKLKNTYKK